MSEEGDYTVTVYRDPQTLKRLDKPQEFKHPNGIKAQEHAERLLKSGLKHHDFTILAPTRTGEETMAEHSLYFKLRAAFVNYLNTVLGDKFNPQMVEDLLAIVQIAQQGEQS